MTASQTRDDVLRQATEITVRYFASTRDAAGVTSDTLPWVDGETVAALRLRLTGARPRLGRLLPACRFAQGDDFAQDSDRVLPGAELAVLPPVSGGAGAGVAPQRAQVVERPIDVGEAARLLNTQGSGAIATFTGVVRDHTGDREVRYLDYEAHVPLAEKELERIVAEAMATHGLVDARVLHRVGHLQLGEVAVDIAASGAHRAETFAGCRHIIEELKKTVPIWKKETDTEGSTWVTPTP